MSGKYLMSWWSEFADRTERDVPLGKQTWFRLGGNVRFVFHPENENDLSAFLRRVTQQDIPVKILGCGANVLISDDGFDGVVVRLDHDAFRRVQQKGTKFEAGAGVDLMPFSRECSENGYTGLECMAGIPATIGGAIKMNAGGRFGEIGQVVQKIRVMKTDGEIEEWSHDRIGFAYRHTDMEDRLILSATLELQEDDPAKGHSRYEEIFDFKMKSQPMADKSAGCIFKNPKGLSAGALIDQAGLKGERHGHASVSRHHANFIVVDRSATASDVLRLIETVRNRVFHMLGTELELEIDIWRPQMKQAEVNQGCIV